MRDDQVDGPGSMKRGVKTDETLSRPLRDQLSAMERYTEFSLFGERDFGIDPEELDGLFQDPLAQALGEVEASIEGSLVPPSDSTQPEPPLLPPPAAGPPLGTPARREPPTLVEPMERPRVELIPPLAARPYFMTHGIESSPHSSRGSAGTGIRNSGPSATTRWCPEAKQFVTEETCRDCEMWQDHGAGYEECYHDWLERSALSENRFMPDEDEE